MHSIAKGLLLAVILSLVLHAVSLAQQVHGELRQWHRVAVDFEGSPTSESADSNPFTDCRLNVTFSGPKGRSLVVPGYYAADGNAAETSAKAGRTWRVCLTPDSVGRWEFHASFRTGENVAVSLDPSAGVPSAFDGASGSFHVASSNRKAPDHRARGLLQYVGEHYLKYAGTGEYFLKGGADSPENFLAYAEFDDTYDADAGSGSYQHVGTFIHTYAPHVRDWRPGDPAWKDGKGKGIIGMLNYLASEGMNSVYFLTYNLDGGDGRDTWMWTAPDVRNRFDCSKLDQWEVVFRHMDRLGIMLHVVTQETENDRKLGGSPGLSLARKLYYREVVARFSHHLAVVWNLGEENNTPDADRKEIARYIRALDVYKHPITVHTHAGKAMTFYDGILGDPFFEATSIQSSMDRYHHEAVVLRQRSALAGRKWAIFGDEQNPAHSGVVPDEDDPNHDEPRKMALWGNLMGGGSGVEWYFGHQFPHMDINCEDWRSRDRMWDQTRHALEFFLRYLPFTQMHPDNAITPNTDDYCFTKPNEVYAVYLPNGGSTELKVGAGTYAVCWYDPRAGGALQRGSIRQIQGPGRLSIGDPPSNSQQDWAALICKPSFLAAREN
ncbi:MAG: DUF5060 domain-containing protein [Planctomycetota bacterium]|jgi:hypothetical protein